jgi:hypothetical protein
MDFSTKVRSSLLICQENQSFRHYVNMVFILCHPTHSLGNKIGDSVGDDIHSSSQQQIVVDQHPHCRSEQRLLVWLGGRRTPVFSITKSIYYFLLYCCNRPYGRSGASTGIFRALYCVLSTFT